MSKESDAVRSQIAALEAELNKRQPSVKARTSTKDALLGEIRRLEAKVKNACGESFMDDDEPSYMDDVEETSFMDDDLVEEPVVLEEDFDDEDFGDEDVDLEEDFDDIVYASETEPGVEDEITQDYLDDVVEEEKNPAAIVTDETMLETAPTGYVARLKSASARLDKVANYLEKQGNKKMALRIDKIADAIDARIKQEASNV